MRILIVEDDSVFAGALMHTLREHGYAVQCVDSGVAADQALLAEQFDLVLLTSGCRGSTASSCWRAYAVARKRCRC